jgi:hypothetical protein
MKNVEDQLDDALDLAKDFLSTDKSDLVKIEVEPKIIEEISSNREDDIEEDYKSSRKNIYDLMNKGYKALDGILELAEDDESARTYEVAGQMLKTMSELNKDAIELQTRLEELKQIESNTTKNVTNNAVFIGSTAELQKLIKGEKDNV